MDLTINVFDVSAVVVNSRRYYTIVKARDNYNYVG